MTGHTKEPWLVQPYVEEGSVYIIGSDLGGLVAGAHSWPTEIDSGDTARVEANAHRIVSCVNALTGIENPAAFVDAARGMMEALEQIANNNWRDQSRAKQVAKESLTAFRAQLGEASNV